MADNSTYDFTETVDSSVAGTTSAPKPKSLRESYGHIPIVEASLSLLFKFLMNQVYWFSKQTSEDNKQIASWATKLVTGDPSPLHKYYGKVVNTINTAAVEYPHSGTVKVTCVYQEDQHKYFNKYVYSRNEITKKFLESKNMTYEKFIQDNAMTLGESNPSHILHQMSQRLGTLVHRLEGTENRNGAASCDYDFCAVDDFKAAQDFFYQLMQEAKLHMSQFKKPSTHGSSASTKVSHNKTHFSTKGKSNQGNQRFTNNSQNRSTANLIPKGTSNGTSNGTPKDTPSVSKPNTVVVPKPSTNVFVSNQVSYSSVAGGNKATTIDRLQNKFAALAEDTDLVDPEPLSEKSISVASVAPVAPVVSTTAHKQYGTSDTIQTTGKKSKTNLRRWSHQPIEKTRSMISRKLYLLLPL